MARINKREVVNIENVNKKTERKEKNENEHKNEARGGCNVDAMHGSNKLFTSVAGCQCQDHSIDHSSSSFSSSIMLIDEGATVSSKNEEKNHE